MTRRKFIKLLAGAAAAVALPIESSGLNCAERHAPLDAKPVKYEWAEDGGAVIISDVYFNLYCANRRLQGIVVG